MGTARSDEPTGTRAPFSTSDLHAFGELYRRYRKPILRYLSARTHDAATAEDLTTLVFIKALTSGHTFRGEGSYKAWLHKIAQNTLMNWQAEKARLQIPVASVPDLSDDADSPTLATIANEERAEILELIDQLPEAQREVVRLRYWKDLTIEEIARFTGRTTGAIRVLLHRSNRSLRKHINAKDLTAIVGATGAAASIAIYSVRRRGKRHQ